jgi:hypothetical protein
MSYWVDNDNKYGLLNMFKPSKIILISGLILATSSTAAIADSYRYQFSLSSKIITSDVSSGNWESIDPVYGPWANKGAQFDCSNWSPSTDTIDQGVIFDQTANDCKQSQERSITPQRKNKITGEVTYWVPVTIDQQTLGQVASTQKATGTGLAPSVVLSGPDAVFIGEPIVLSWSGQNAVKYNLSGDAISPVSLGEGYNSYSLTASLNGTNNYSIEAVGSATKKAVSEKTVTVEGLPWLTVKYDGYDSVVLAGSAIPLKYSGTPGGIYSSPDFDWNSPKASSKGETKAYTVNLEKTLNGVTKKATPQSFTLTTVEAALLTSFTSSTQDIAQGQNFTLSWTGSNLYNCNINNNQSSSYWQSKTVSAGSGNITQNGGSVTFPSIIGASSSVTYKISCSNSYAIGSPAVATVTIASHDPTPKINAFTLAKTTVPVGQNFELAWNTQNMTYCSITINWNLSWGGSATSKAETPDQMQLSGSMLMGSYYQGTYPTFVLSCKDAAGSVYTSTLSGYSQ